MIIIVFLVFCIFAGLVLAGIAAPIIIVRNRKILREMEAVIDDFESINPEHREPHRGKYQKKLLELKSKIFVSDKQSLERARDLVDAL